MRFFQRRQKIYKFCAGNDLKGEMVAKKLREMEFEWPELGIKITAKILDLSQNKKLCDFVWEHLPIESYTFHVVVSGRQLYVPTKMILTPSMPEYQTIPSESKPGNVTIYPPGQSLILETSTDVRETAEKTLENYLKFAEVKKQDLEKLRQVEKIIWEKTIISAIRDLVRVIIRRKEI